MLFHEWITRVESTLVTFAESRLGYRRGVFVNFRRGEREMQRRSDVISEECVKISGYT